MAAKRKSKTSPFEELKEEEVKIAAEVQADQQLGIDADEARPPAFAKREFSKEELERLDMLDATIASNQKLIAENASYNEHIEEYIQENEALKRKVASLENDLSKAKMDNDALLMKISELTFDLAKVQSEFDNIKYQSTQQTQASVPLQAPQVQQKDIKHVSKQVPYPRRNRNGYTDWN